MKTKVRFIAFPCICALWIAVSCAPYSDNTQQFIGQSIVLPSTLNAIDSNFSVTGFSTDTLHFKFIIYYNSQVCSSCKVKELLRWQSRLTDSMQSNNETIRYLYVFHTSDKRMNDNIRETLTSYSAHLPLYYDKEGDFERLNPSLPKNPVFHTFLLDRNNRVVLVGSPVGNPKMWSLYKETIQKLAASGGQLKSSDHTSPLRNLTPQIEKNAYSWSKEKP